MKIDIIRLKEYNNNIYMRHYMLSGEIQHHFVSLSWELNTLLTNRIGLVKFIITSMVY